MVNTQEKIKNIIHIYRELSEQTDLKPSKKVDGLFDELISICVTTNKEDSNLVLQDEEIRKASSGLRRLCSIGESRMEEVVASKVIESQSPQQELERFKYYQNYLELTEKELLSIKNNSLNTNSKKILFIGSGPLPLSAIFLAQNGYTIECIDTDKVSVDISKLLIEKLGLKDSIKIHQEDIRNQTSFKEYKAVMLASLVGENQKEKKEIIDILATKAQRATLFLFRSTDNLGELLYQQVPLSVLTNFQVIQKIEATPRTVNSVITAFIKNNSTEEAQNHVNVLLEKFNTYKSKQLALSVAEKTINNKQVDFLKKEMSTIGDDMKFDTPLIWLMYKNQAYRNTEKEIITLGHLRKHVDHPGDICYKRFNFLYTYLLSKEINIQDKNIFSDEMSLVSFYNLNEILKFSEDEKSIQAWRHYEYHLNNGQVAKWQNYTEI